VSEVTRVCHLARGPPLCPTAAWVRTNHPEAATRERARSRVGFAVNVIASKRYGDDAEKWAYGMVGLVVMYWFKESARP
jgi:hypothetical protein